MINKVNKRYLVIDGKELEVRSVHTTVRSSGTITDVYTTEPAIYSFWGSAPFVLVERTKTFSNTEQELSKQLDLLKRQPQTILLSEPDPTIDWEKVFAISISGIATAGALLFLGVTVYLLIATL